MNCSLQKANRLFMREKLLEFLSISIISVQFELLTFPTRLSLIGIVTSYLKIKCMYNTNTTVVFKMKTTSCLPFVQIFGLIKFKFTTR